MTTPQKIFQENFHFWILPILLIIIKILFDLLPKIIFIPLFLGLIGFIISNNQYKEKQEELLIKELENKADLFLDELNELERIKEEKEKIKKEKKDKLNELRIKNQEKQKVLFLFFFYFI